MLQLKSINQAALGVLEGEDGFPPKWSSMAELEQVTNAWIDRLRRERESIARKRGGLRRFAEWFDRKVRTDKTEHLDDPDFPEKTKLKMVTALHQMNVLVRSYSRFLKILEPTLLEVAEREGRPARLLELACGSGKFTLALAKQALKRGLPVEITGSDYIPTYVDSANREAESRKIPASFRLINAFDMHNVEKGAYDVVFIAQSLHHFSPGQLAMMIAQAGSRATAFVGVDGFRSIPLLLFVPGITFLKFRPIYFHDALITARKLYPASELDLIGRIAAPDARVFVDRRFVWFSVLRTRFKE